MSVCGHNCCCVSRTSALLGHCYWLFGWSQWERSLWLAVQVSESMNEKRRGKAPEPVTMVIVSPHCHLCLFASTIFNFLSDIFSITSGFITESAVTDAALSYLSRVFRFPILNRDYRLTAPVWVESYTQQQNAQVSWPLAVMLWCVRVQHEVTQLSVFVAASSSMSILCVSACCVMVPPMLTHFIGAIICLWNLKMRQSLFYFMYINILLR